MPIRVYCADCSESSCAALGAAVRKEADMLWTGSATDGCRAYEEIRRMRPDVLVQTLVLPRLDGFSLLERVCALPSAPAVIVTSHLIREFCIEESIRLGATYYLVKPVPDELIIRRIRDICRLRTRFSAQESEAASPLERREEGVRALLRDIGVRPGLKGHAYLVDAVFLAVSLQRFSLQRAIYPQIAQKYDASPASVERAIRHAALAAWTRPDTETRRRLFGEARPSNRLLIQRLARETEPLLREDRER